MPSSEVLTIIGVLISVVSLLLSIIFFAVARKRRLLTYTISSTPLVTEKMTQIPKLEIFYDGQPVKDLTSTTVAFTNSGNQLLEPDSFAARQPLCLNASGQFFHGQSEVEVTANNPNSIPSIEQIDEQTIKIVFDFLEPKCSFGLTILHQGELTISGDLKGGKITPHVSAPNWDELAPIIIFSFLGIGSLALLFLFLIADKLDSYIFLLLCATVFMIWDVFLLWDFQKSRRS